MTTIDFREFLATELQDPETRRNFVIAYYQEDGVEGLRVALEEIALADATIARENAGKSARRTINMRTALNELELDLQLVSLREPSESALTSV